MRLTNTDGIHHTGYVLRFTKIFLIGLPLFFGAMCVDSRPSFAADAEVPAPEFTYPEGPEISAKFSVATGVTYLDFNQTFASGANKNLSFEGFDIPNFSFLFESTISESSFLKVNFLRYTPSSTDSNSNTAVAQKKLGISTLGLDYNYLPFSSSSRSFLKKWGLSGGFQFTSLPLLNRTGPSTVSSEIFWDLFLKFGLFNTFSFSEKWSLTSSFTYLLPTNAISEFQVAGATFLEAEFVLLRKINQSWDLGIGWQLRKHTYDITGRVLDGVTNQAFRAQQDNMYSILYIQSGYSW